MKPVVADIVKDSKRLLREVLSVCADFPQKLKFIVSDRMYGYAIDGLLRAQDAARLGDKRAAEQLPIVLELIEHNDKLQALIDAAYDLHCFKSTGQFEVLLNLAEKIGAKAGGWRRRIINALPNQQNPAASVPRDRLGVLSTDAASAEAKT